MMTKKNLHEELVTRYKEYFESKLAVSLLHQRRLFPGVEKVSAKIVNLLIKHRSKIIRIIGDDIKITQELFDKDFFGRFDLIKQTLSAEEVWESMMEVLMQSESLDKIMQLHSVFMYRIARYLNLTTVNKIPILNLSDRGRKETEHSARNFSNALGITKNKVFTKLLKSETYEHNRGIDKFIPDCQSMFFKNMETKQIPFTAGLSAHTASFVKGAMQLDLRGEEELKEYLLASFVFLAAGGNHSFHEVMSIGKQIGINYLDGDYMSCLPLSFLNTHIFSDLKNLFPDLLECNEFELEINDQQMANSVFGQSAYRKGAVA